jgi:hypothetical protein
LKIEGKDNFLKCLNHSKKKEVFLNESLILSIERYIFALA